MDWVKLSARYYLDAVVANLPDADTEVMFTRALAYAGDQETGGFIPQGMLPALCRARRYEACARALVSSGLWLAVRGGYQITRWEEWQSELEAIARRRSADRERKRQQRLREKQEPHVRGMSRDTSADGHADSPPDSLSMSLGTTTGGTKRKETSEPDGPDVAAAPPSRDDIERVCNHLATRIEANGSRRPAVTKRWRDAARLMLDSDGRTEQQVIAAIDWCQDHEFWRGVILSMSKLRQKYDQLRLQASRREILNGRQAETDAQFDRQMARARAKENHDPERNGAAHPLRQSLLPPAGDG